MDWRYGDFDQGRRTAETAANRTGTSQANHQPGEGNYVAGAGDSPQSRGIEGAGPPCRLLPVFGTDRGGQDGSSTSAWRVPVRQREILDSFRHVRVHGKALCIKIDWRASGIRRVRRGWAIDRARAADALFCDPPR